MTDMIGASVSLLWAMTLLRLISSLATPLDQAKGFTGVRFSLYPNLGKDNSGGESPSLRSVIKSAVKDLPSLGLEVKADDVSSVLLGPEPALFEAMRVAFARAGRTEEEDGLERQINMQCTFSAGCPGEPDESPLPERTASSEDGREFVADAYRVPSRIAAQFAVYPLGAENHMETIYKVIDHAKASNVWKEGKTYFCSMLDGEGNAVFDVLRSSFAVAREFHPGSHVVMTATLTANKRMWKEEKKAS